MRTRAADHLRLVEDRPAEVVPPPAPRAHVRRIAASTVALAVVLGLLAGQRWELPQRAGGGVADVPQALLTFLLVCAGSCLWAAGRATRPAESFRSPVVARVWWTLVSAAALVSVAADLSLASYAGAGARPTDLLVRWAVPVVPAVLAGVLAQHDGRAVRVRAALGTGVVTLPMAAVGWVLAAAPGDLPLDPADVVSMILLVGVTPFALAVAFVAADRRRRFGLRGWAGRR